MEKFLRHLGYMTLVLLGASIQIGSSAVLKSLGPPYGDSTVSFLSSLGTVLVMSLIVSGALFFVNRISGQTNGTVPSANHSRAIESRNTAIQALRRKLSETEHELKLIRRSFAEIEPRVGILETERDALKQSNRGLEIKLKRERQKVKSAQTRMKELRREGKSWKRAGDTACAKLTQERQKGEIFENRIVNLEKELDGLKQASNRANRELEQERQKVDNFQNRIKDLEQELQDTLENISTDLINSDTVLLLSAKAWKERGDNREIQKWRALLSKIKNPLLRSQQERADGDGFVYPRGAEARRVRYLREEKRITVIKICEIYRKHVNNKQYNEGRTKGMEAAKYEGADFSYMLLEKAT
jgi:peptidoglycan hydrolase CwlO-like protein